MDRLYTDEEVKAACIREHLRRRGEPVPRRWQGEGPLVYEKWKTLSENRRYEMNPVGSVRVRHGERNGGHVLRRFTKNGSLCVEVWKGTKHTTLRVWHLMDKYYKDTPYPQDWKPKPRVKVVVEKEDGRRKLTEEQRQGIKDSPLSPMQIHRTGEFPVGRRHISRIKNGV
jgi:hypothetical protein